MSILAYLVLGFAAAMVGLQVWGVVSARRLQGTPAPDTGELVPPELAAAPRLVFYFYGERCGPCRALAPLVDRLQAGHPNLIKVDVARHPEVARRFRVMGTPTFVLVEQGHVAKVVLGGMTEQALTDMLEKRAIDKS